VTQHIDYTFTLNDRFCSEDSTLIVLNIAWHWTHSIFGTHEEANAIIVVQSGDPGSIIVNGTRVNTEELERFDPHGWFEQYAAFLDTIG
jgi:hypothetical protein